MVINAHVSPEITHMHANQNRYKIAVIDVLDMYGSYLLIVVPI